MRRDALRWLSRPRPDVRFAMRCEASWATPCDAARASVATSALRTSRMRWQRLVSTALCLPLLTLTCSPGLCMHRHHHHHDHHHRHQQPPLLLLMPHHLYHHRPHHYRSCHHHHHCGHRITISIPECSRHDHGHRHQQPPLLLLMPCHLYRHHPHRRHPRRYCPRLCHYGPGHRHLCLQPPRLHTPNRPPSGFIAVIRGPRVESLDPTPGWVRHPRVLGALP